jgi:hypothetical protein
MAIALGQPSTSRTKHSADELLAQWGGRLWTFPEVLLSPQDDIHIYVRGQEDGRPQTLKKSQFAAQVWDRDEDSHEASQLLSHYTGSLTLSRLELAVLGLRCLYRRETAIQHLPGDPSYALMGLLRMRPDVEATDTPFQAFARYVTSPLMTSPGAPVDIADSSPPHRLSLANDSDMLLERQLCLLPPHQADLRGGAGQQLPWHQMGDVYGAAAWDVVPQVQVAAICSNDTVVLDGAKGASIRWKSFYPVGHTRLVSWRRWLATWLMYLNGYTVLIAALLINSGIPPSTSSPYDGSSEGFSSFDALRARQFSSYWNPLAAYGIGSTSNLGAGVVLLLVGLGMFFRTPALIRTILGGKFRDVQPELFAVEGYMSAATAEKGIFGIAAGRMAWSTNGSPLCRSYLNPEGELVGVDPSLDSEVKRKIELAKVAMPGGTRVS